MTIKEYIKQGKQQSAYWKSTGKSTGKIFSEETKKKTSWFKKVWNSAVGNSKQGGQSGQSGQKDFGSEEAYNDATQILDAGDFINKMAIMKRFHFGNEYGSESHNDVFFNGFEDPTHLTFKIEFGEFGASITDNATIASIQKNSLSSNVFFMDYDKMPMGLLDLNYSDIIGTGANARSNIVFNEQQTYNAVNYLINRNEDRRAQYLRDFIEGIYTIQRDFPYIFQKITGISKLFEVDVTRGQRLKDVILQLTCMPDGVDQKIHTLIELYRKAAWDDQYQRWVLPDIMRYFKMVIYVFDNRSLQMGNGEFSPDQDMFPIFAFECMPCEFTLKSVFDNEYTQDYFSLKTGEPVIEIKVQNVKTYMSNNLFQRVKYIKDIITKTDHYAVNDSESTFTFGQNIDWRFRWLQRMFLLPDEYNAFYNFNGPDSGNPTGITHYVGDRGDWEGFPLRYAEIIQPEDTWHRATVSDHGYVIRSAKQLWNTLGKIITQNTVLIRDSRTANRYYFVNDLSRLDPDTFVYYCNHKLVNLDIDKMKQDVRARIKKLMKVLKDFRISMNTTVMDKIQNPLLVTDEDEEKPEQNMTELVIDVSLSGSKVQTQKFVSIDKNLKKSEQKLTDIISDFTKPKQDFTTIDKNLDKPEQKMNPILSNLELPEQELVNLILNLDMAEQTLVQLEQNLDEPIQNMIHLIPDLSKTLQNMVNLYLNLDKPSQNITKIVPDLEKQEQELADIILNLDKAKQELTQLELNLVKPEENFVEIEQDLTKTVQNIAQLILNLKKPIHEYISLIIDESKPEQNLQELLLNLEKSEQNLIEIVQNLDKQKQNMSEIDLNLDKTRMSMNKINKNLEKPEHNMVELEPDLTKQEHNYVSLEIDLTKPNMNMSEIEQNLDRQKQNMVEIEPDLSKTEHNYVSIVSELDKAEMNMTEIDMNLDKQKHNMVEIESDLSKNSSMNMVSADINVDKADMNMTELELNVDKHQHNMIGEDPELRKPQHNFVEADIDISHGNMNMISIDSNDDHSHMNMSEIESDLSKRPMNMVSADINVDKSDMNIHQISLELEKAEMNMSGIEQNIEKSEMKMTEQVLDERHIDMEMISADMNVEHTSMNMIEGVIDDSHSKMDMVHGEQNTDHQTQEMTEMQVDARKSDMDKNSMSHIDRGSEYKRDMSDVKMVESGTPDEIKMTQIIDNSENVNMKMTELTANDELSDMKMSEIKTDDVVIEMKMSELIDGESSGDMKMSELEQNLEISDMKMTELNESESLDEMKMSEMNDNSDNASDMKMAVLNENPKTPIDKLSLSHIETGEEYRREISDVEISGGKSGEMIMNEIQDDEVKETESQRIERVKNALSSGQIVNDTRNRVSSMLMSKIETLSNLDLDSLQNASMEQLAKLVQIMEDTVNDARKQMKMTEIKQVNSKTGTVMKMPTIVQPERNQFLGKPLMSVDDAAMERAESGVGRFKDRNSFMKNHKE